MSCKKSKIRNPVSARCVKVAGKSLQTLLKKEILQLQNPLTFREKVYWPNPQFVSDIVKQMHNKVQKEQIIYITIALVLSQGPLIGWTNKLLEHYILNLLNGHDLFLRDHIWRSVARRKINVFTPERMQKIVQDVAQRTDFTIEEIFKELIYFIQVRFGTLLIQ